MVLCVALNYGGRAEIVDAANALLAERQAAGDAARVTEADIERHLYTAGLPDPDLLIRTSGELRVSNFLLWQIAYAELFVTDTLWPDFNRARLLEAFVDFQTRDRRYGGIGESEESDRRSTRQAGK
jgi:undecaprenyl diphosphate synthase